MSPLLRSSQTPLAGQRDLDGASIPDWLRLHEDLPVDSGPLSASALPSMPRSPEPPEIPGYEIMRELGRGGMGIVYMARHQSLDRVVALKMLLSGNHTDAAGLARFQAEGEAIAQLHHPNIVQIFEVGSHLGLPYFTLEYVEGGNLGDFLKQGQPSLSIAAKLVETLARAVQDAHQCGILHRDLKPANILLKPTHPREVEFDRADTRADPDTKQPAECEVGRLIPKIADFGLAKRLEGDRGLTRSGAILGTPAYMAPEQLSGKSELGPTVDVYSLGVILHETLTGRPPFEAGNPTDLLLQVNLHDPLPPSYWRPQVPADLDTICLKCLRKEPKERYATAADLADDLSRYLQGRPIQARPLGYCARSWRWCRRNPRLALLTTLVVLLLGATVLALVLGLVMVRAEEMRTELARQEAVTSGEETRSALRSEARHRRQLQAALDAMTSTMMDNLLARQPTLTEEHRKFLRDAVRMYAEFAAETSGDRASQKGVAESYARLAQIQRRLGEYKEAESAYRKAIAGFETLAAEPEAGSEDRLAVAVNRSQLGCLLRDQGRWEDAERELRQVVTAYEQLTESNSGNADTRQRLGAAHGHLGVLLEGCQRGREAEAEHRKAVAILVKLVQEHPAMPEYRRTLAQCHHHLANRLKQEKRLPEAQKECRQALATLRNLAPTVGTTPEYQQITGDLHDQLAVLLTESLRLGEAEAEHQKAIEVRAKLAHAFPVVSGYGVSLGKSYCNLADLTQKKQDYKAALYYCEKAHEILAPVYEREKTSLAARTLLRDTVWQRAKALTALGRHPKAAQDWFLASVLSPEHERAMFQLRHSVSLVRSGDHVQAMAVVDQLAKNEELGAETVYQLACVSAGGYYLLAGQSADQDAYAKRAYALLRRAQALGYFNEPARRALLDTDARLNPLRGRADFATIKSQILVEPNRSLPPSAPDPKS